MFQNLSSAAVVIGALRVKLTFSKKKLAECQMVWIQMRTESGTEWCSVSPDLGPNLQKSADFIQKLPL